MLLSQAHAVLPRQGRCLRIIRVECFRTLAVQAERGQRAVLKPFQRLHPSCAPSAHRVLALGASSPLPASPGPAHPQQCRTRSLGLIMGRQEQQLLLQPSAIDLAAWKENPGWPLGSPVYSRGWQSGVAAVGSASQLGV